MDPTAPEPPPPNQPPSGDAVPSPALPVGPTPPSPPRTPAYAPAEKVPDSWTPLALGGLAMLLLQGVGRTLKDHPFTADESPAHAAGRLTALVAIPCAAAFFAVLTGLRVVRRGAGWNGASGCGILLGGFVLVVLLGATGIGFLTKGRQPRPLPPRTAPAPVPDGAARAFARELERSYAARDPSLLDERLDLGGLVGRLQASIARDPRFLEGAREALQKNAFGQQIMATIASDRATVELLRLRTRDGQTTAVFRVMGSPRGLNYHELWLVQRPDGAVAYDDLLAFNGSVRMSELCGRMAEDLRVANQLASVALPLRQGKPDEALEAYHRLPAELQDRLDVIQIRHQAAQQVGGTEESSALSALERYASDPGVSLLLLDEYLTRGEHDRALTALDTIDAAVGGDPWLDALRAEVELDRGDLARAKALAERALAAVPGRAFPSWLLLEVALQTADHQATREQFDRLTALGEPPDPADDPRLAALLASPEGVAPVESR